MAYSVVRQTHHFSPQQCASRGVAFRLTEVHTRANTMEVHVADDTLEMTPE